ncbi:MAG: hypothetical protein AB7F59_05990 [Bdellovibrionales bacterium]
MRNSTLGHILSLFISLAFFLPQTVSADVVYEGWHKVLSAGQHVGYYIIRYELDSKTKKFIQTSFLKSNAMGNDVTEALKAESLQITKPNQWILPVKYQYTSSVGKKVKIIDAAFKEEKGGGKKSKDKKKTLRMVASITENGKTSKVDQILPENTFLSSFLTYIILQSKEGLKTGNNYTYNAVAEEDATVSEGTAFVKEEEKFNGQDAFKVINEFKKIRFISYLTPQGEILGTKSPLLSIATEAAKTPEEAAGKVKIDTKNITHLFGNIPSAQKKK